MNKYCVVLEIKPEYLEDYKEVHRHVWKDLLKSIKDSGVKEEVMFFYKNLAIVYFEADDLNKSYEIQRKSVELEKGWDDLVGPWISKGEYKPGTYELDFLEKVFDLNEQLEEEN
jgi:L-rhamnose mutarotase